MNASVRTTAGGGSPSSEHEHGTFLCRYGELLSADRYRDGFTPWKRPVVLAGRRHVTVRGELDGPVAQDILQPLEADLRRLLLSAPITRSMQYRR